MARVTPLDILITIAVLAIPGTSSAADLRGDEFITTVDGNTISGNAATGLAFDLYFLPGGHVTYSSLGRANVSGTWQLDRDGNVCIKWPQRVAALEGCFRMSFDGDTVIWRNRSVSGRGMLRSGAVESASKAQN
jgi:hypothetical protein